MSNNHRLGKLPMSPVSSEGKAQRTIYGALRPKVAMDSEGVRENSIVTPEGRSYGKVPSR